MDRLRFRAWDKELRMYDGVVAGNLIYSMCDPDEDIDAEDAERFTVEQCTGLRDANGVLIYEGDVVKSHRFNGLVEWKLSMWRIKPIGKWTTDYHAIEKLFGNAENAGRPFTVIGNIHQHKELLEATND